MYPVDPHFLARTLVEDRLREATSLRPGRAFRATGESVGTQSSAPRSRRRHGLGRLVHVRHAYS